jgi:transcriptional regulator with XRE-family HTH domain
MYGKLLKQFTMDTGISQKDVAIKLKYSPQRVGNYYRDIADPPFEFLEGFRNEYGIDLKREKEKEDKGVAAGVALFNPIPVFNFDIKPTNDLDFFNHSELIVNYINVPLYNDCFAAVVVSGQDMAPLYNPSDLVAIKRITDLEVIPFGAPFFIITDEQRLLRYVYEHDKKTFILKAANERFGDMSIPKNKVKYLFQVKGKMTKL